MSFNEAFLRTKSSEPPRPDFVAYGAGVFACEQAAHWQGEQSLEAHGQRPAFGSSLFLSQIGSFRYPVLTTAMYRYDLQQTFISCCVSQKT